MATLEVQKFPQEGDFTHTYHALRNVLDENNKIVEFNTDEIKVDLNNPLNIECQPSYDGTVNLIINDDIHPPRIINSRFSRIENNRFKIINRNQKQQTNLYKKGYIDQQTRLFKNITTFPVIDLFNIDGTGQLKGGNYTFYFKYADEDFNKTDFVAESGIVSVFKGQLDNISSISGTLLDELTDKSITLKLSNLDRAYSRLYIYYTRDTSDTNGVRLTSAYMINEPFIIQHDTEYITITGYEEVSQVSIEDLNIQYNLVTAAKTQAQVQNMLFLGNTQGTNLNLKDLQNISYFIGVTLKREDNIGFVDPKDYSVSGDDAQNEYYSPYNIYYKLGYWPDEMYRLGVVYIMRDDSLSPVFNLRGTSFENINNHNLSNNISLYKDANKKEMNYLEQNSFIGGGGWLDNTFGVFKTPNENIISNNKVSPLYFEITLSKDLRNSLREYGVKGYFIVRQKRIPTSLCQGLSVGIDRYSYTPLLRLGDKWFGETFVTSDGILSTNFKDRIGYVNGISCSGLLSVDANSIPSLKSTFDGSDFYLTSGKEEGTLNVDDKNERHFYITEGGNSPRNYITKTIYVNSETPLKHVCGYSYSTKCGTSEDVSQFSFLGNRVNGNIDLKLVRGLYCPYLGTSTILPDNTVYTIKIPNYSKAYLKNYFKIRQNDNSPFFAISNRISIDSASSINVFRGDCYTNTVTMRLNRNFIDSEVPVNETIIDSTTWADNYKGYLQTVNGKEEDDTRDVGDYTKINRADVNTVPLGIWVTFKCLSSYNLGLRSIDYSHVDEQALMGNPRSFYPVSDISTNVSHKIEESYILNQGYGATVGHKREFAASNVPYIQELFDNRIYFSNVQAYGDFQNAYRIFQGLDYKDIERQYGAIVKLLPWNNNLLCVFEHGIGVLPINEKALLATQSGQSIHMYGAGVLQNQVTVISPDFGSIWQESIIKTPIGVYGVDTYAKKIWRVTYNNSFETISDMKVQRFLNDNIKLSESDKKPIIGIKNVKTHFNNFKGDVMFTFYNEAVDANWNLCYNERMGKWITRYSWTPLYSENIDNIFYSIDQKRTSVYGCIYNNISNNYGIHTNKHEINEDGASISITLAPDTGQLSSKYIVKLKFIKTEYINNENIIKEAKIDSFEDGDPISISNNTLSIGSFNSLKTYFKKHFDDMGEDPPVYYILGVSVEITYGNGIISFDDSIGIICNYSTLSNWEDLKSKFLSYRLFVHGKAGIFNEIDYEDKDFDNQILPTKWYNKQEPFEFEFVVNDQVGAHKIFNDLVIISNNVQPKELEFEIEGDVFNFNKAGIFRDSKWPNNNYLWDEKYNKPIKTIDHTGEETTYQATQEFNNCKVVWDTNLNSYSLIINQECKNIGNPKYGRRLGNIQYKEDSWYTNIEPIMYKERFKIKDKEEATFREGKEKSARIRDKYMKVRVKYTGEDLVIITALKTLYTLSYA